MSNLVSVISDIFGPHLIQLKRYGMPYIFMALLQPLHWRCVKRAIHHEQDVREE